jgi:BASS family bile acid:Na+ symporter
MGRAADSGVDHQMASLPDVVLWITLWATGVGVGVTLAGQPRRWPMSWPVTAVVIAVNVVLQPALAWVLVHVLHVGPDPAIGLILVGAASGGALGITTTRVAGGDVRAAVALVALLEALNLVTIPAWLAIGAFGSVAPPVVDVVRALILLLIAPTVVGWAVARARPALRSSIVAVAGRLSAIGLVAVVLLVVWGSGPVVLDLIGSTVMPAAVIMAVVSLALGAMVGGLDPPRRRMLSLVTAGQANALALGVARGSFPDRAETEAAVIVAGLVGILSTTLTAWYLGGAAARIARRVPARWTG